MSKLSKQYLIIMSREPYITEIVTSLGKEFHCEMAGLDHRLKSWHSAVEKATVRTRINDLYKLNDMVRYTMLLPEDKYGELANMILNACARYGIHVEKVTNYWNNSNSGYNGINVQVYCKGLRCELQFHTADSLRVKEEENHPVYEQLRVLPANSPEALYLQNVLLEIGVRQKKPNGCESVRWMNEEKEEVIAR